VFNVVPTMHGQAKIRDWTDEEGTDVFRRLWMDRRILEAYQEFHRRGESRISFLRITRDPMVYTYMVGRSIWQLRRRMDPSGQGRRPVPRDVGLP
jgi:hypothetical protein